jgi:tetratricopeptide (TPR) repeat protein
MPLTVPIPLALGRFSRLPQRTNEVWQGGLVRMPMWIDHPTDPNGPPYRPIGAVWVSLRTGLMHVAMPTEGSPASPEFALGALIEFGMKWAKELAGRPSRVEVRDPALRDALATSLDGLSTTVAVVDDLPAVRDVLAHFESSTSGSEPIPGLLDVPDVTLKRLRAFADAASSFYQGRPWQHLANEDLIVVEADSAPKGMRHVSVLGQGGQQFGLAFFDSRRDFDRLVNRTGRSGPPKRAYGVTFGTIDELPFADGDAWEDHALPVAGPYAYPLAADLHSDGRIARPGARELTYCEALLRALATTTEDELDAGRWEKQVQTFDGAATLRMTLPLLLEAEKESSGTRGPFAARFAAERGAARISRLLENQSFESLEDVNAALEQARQTGLFDEPDAGGSGRALTPLERAQELVYDAIDADGRLRLKRARQALAISPDCADAWSILAEDAPDAATTLARYEQAVAAGERAIGPERFNELAGEFWGRIETRPYMRARASLAHCLEHAGRGAEAVAHYQELLRLNPGDNQGVRYLLVVALLKQNRNEEAGALLDTHPDDEQALWPYARALWSFRTKGATAASRAVLQHAIRVNPHALTCLLDPEPAPFDREPSFALGSREEAAYVEEELGDLYDATPGALEWLRSVRPKAEGRRPKRRTKP